MKTLASICAPSMRTPMGPGATETAFFMRTSLPLVAPSPLALPDGSEAVMAFDPTLDPGAVGPARLELLARAALLPIAAKLRELLASLRVKTSIALDEPLPGEPEDPSLGVRVRAVLSEVGIKDAQIAARGAGGAMASLSRALDELGENRCDVVLLGGLHTDYDPARLARLSHLGRLFDLGNKDGIIPGEAAAFIVVTRRDIAARAGMEICARVVGCAASKGPPDSEASPFEAEALTRVIRDATAPLPSEIKIGWLYGDSTFESARVHEAQIALMRTRERFGEPFIVDSPAQRLGFMGAAAPAVMLGLAAAGFRHQLCATPFGLCFGGTSSGERGAFVVGAP